jgi:hypothetical protein
LRNSYRLTCYCKDPESILLTNDDYRDGIVKPYQDRIKKLNNGEDKMGRCVVLDTFAGIGTGIVVLKRLGIAMEKVKMMCPAHYCMP